MNISIKTSGCVAACAALVTGLAATGAFGSSALKHGESAKIGAPAPSWSLPDTKGATHTLGEYAGKIVVLEWTNHQCPYVQKHYRTGNMQSLQKYATSHGAVWLSVISSGKGREGFVSPEEGQKISTEQHSNATAKLLDPDGTVGHEYGAKTTPDIMIIDKSGKLVYTGGIDDTPTTDDSDVKTAHNYVRAALSDLFAGKSVQVTTSQPYGCGVKYGS